VLNLASNLLIHLTIKVGAIDPAPKGSTIPAEHLFSFERRLSASAPFQWSHSRIEGG
jgi:hypothetical protein